MAWRGPGFGNSVPRELLSDLRIEVKERIQTGLQLLLDFLSAALEHMHGHMSFASVFEFQRRISDVCDLIGGQQSHSINQCKVGHALILVRLRGRYLPCALSIRNNSHLLEFLPCFATSFAQSLVSRFALPRRGSRNPSRRSR